MKKSEAIDILKREQWTEADAKRALENIDFKNDPDELAIRREISFFAGSELIQRQRLQAAQKAMVTRKTKEIDELRNRQNTYQEVNYKALEIENSELIKANERLKKDNKDLKNLVDAIKLNLAKGTQKLLKLEDSEIRQAVAKWFKTDKEIN